MNQVAKAIIAAVTALAGGIGTALADGQITTAEWVVIIPAALIAGVAVWGTTNAPTQEPKP